jgi:hypothetical protein
MSDVFRPRQWYWDVYEDSLLDFVSELQEDFQAVPRETSELAVWQMFLYIFDSHLATLKDRELFFQRIDESLRAPKAERDIAQGKVLCQLQDCLPEAYEVWRHQMRPMTTNYSEWLVDLING